MKRRLRLHAAALAAFALPLSGCFSYVPVETEAVAPGEDVRVYLTRQGLAELEQLPIERGPTVRGSVVRRDDATVFLRVPVSNVSEGFHSISIGQDVPIPSSAIVQMERREFNRGGTALLVAGTAAMAASVIYLILEGGGGEDEPDPPEPPEIRIPLFSVPVP